MKGGLSLAESTELTGLERELLVNLINSALLPALTMSDAALAHYEAAAELQFERDMRHLVEQYTGVPADTDDEVASVVADILDSIVAKLRIDVPSTVPEAHWPIIDQLESL